MFTKLINKIRARKDLVSVAKQLQKVEFRHEHPEYVYFLLKDGKL